MLERNSPIVSRFFLPVTLWGQLKFPKREKPNPINALVRVLRCLPGHQSCKLLIIIELYLRCEGATSAIEPDATLNILISLSLATSNNASLGATLTPSRASLLGCADAGRKAVARYSFARTHARRNTDQDCTGAAAHSRCRPIPQTQCKAGMVERSAPPMETLLA